MATHSTAMKVAVATAARTTFNGGSAALQAVEFRTAGAAPLTSIALSNPAFGVPDAGGIITAGGLPATGTVATGGGTVTQAVVKDRDGAVHETLTIGTSAQDINFNAVVWVAGATVTLSSLTWQLV